MNSDDIFRNFTRKEALMKGDKSLKPMSREEFILQGKNLYNVRSILNRDEVASAMLSMRGQEDTDPDPIYTVEWHNLYIRIISNEDEDPLLSIPVHYSGSINVECYHGGSEYFFDTHSFPFDSEDQYPNLIGILYPVINDAAFCPFIINFGALDTFCQNNNLSYTVQEDSMLRSFFSSDMQKKFYFIDNDELNEQIAITIDIYPSNGGTK